MSRVFHSQIHTQTISAYCYSKNAAWGGSTQVKLDTGAAFYGVCTIATHRMPLSVWIEDDFKLSTDNIHKIESEAANVAKSNDNRYAVINGAWG